MKPTFKKITFLTVLKNKMTNFKKMSKILKL